MAINTKNDLSNLWMAMGRTTPWQDEENPPQEDPTVTSLDDTILGYRRFDRALLVVPVDPTSPNPPTGSGVISYKANQWEVVADADAYAKQARYVYLDAKITPGEDNFSYGVYRQVGLYHNLVPATGYESNVSLNPAQVADPGMLVGFDNNKSQRFTDNVSILEQIIVKF